IAELGVECFRVQFPAGADANDVLVADGPDGLARAVRRSVWLGQGPGPASYRNAEPLVAPEPPPPSSTIEPDIDPDADPVPSFAAEPPPPPDPPAGPESFMDSAGLPASPVPPSPPGTPAPTVAGDELTVVYGDRRWRVRGLSKVTSFDLLRLNVLVGRDDPRTGQVFHVDTLDLYSARSRGVFVKQAADELAVQEDTVKRDLGRVLLACESAAEEGVRSATEAEDTTVVLSAEEEAAALELLRDPLLVSRILDGFSAAGVVGEETNKLVGYLAAVSRKLPDPLAVMVRSSSAAGKSSLLDAVLSFVPEEDRVAYSAMTGQSLFYMGERDLAHKVLAIAEEEGAARASYALKLLQSEGELSIASTGKDPATGRLRTHTYRVVGPVAILTTTTAAEVDEELLNRCIVLTVDEDRAQTRAIHDRQRAAQTIDGLLARKERDAVMALHRNAQRLLKPMLVANPFAPRLGFADERTRTRRDHMKYLALIRAIALLHQHQRTRKTVTHGGREVAYIEASVADVALANRLAAEVLGRSLDELAPQSRRLLEVLDDLVGAIAAEAAMERAEVRFSRRDLRERCGWGDTQLKVHLARLVELELVVVHKGGRGQSFVYELAWDGSGRDGSPFLTGLIDAATLAANPAADTAYDPDRSGRSGTRSGVGRPPVGPRSGGGRNPSAAANGQASGQMQGNGGGERKERTSADDAAPSVIGDQRPAPARAS
ncbi:MAG: DNA primase, partial [Acidimicrobiales bacterium]